MKNRKGFTLIELVIVIAILGIILPMIFSPITFSLKNFKIQNEKTSIISDARATMAYLTREIRKSTKVTVTGDTIEIDNEVNGPEDTIDVDSNFYEIKDENLIKKNLIDNTINDMVISEGIKELIIKVDDLEVDLEIVIKEGQKITIIIKDSKGDSRSSDIYMRKKDKKDGE